MKRVVYMLSGLVAVATVSAATNAVYAERAMVKSVGDCGSYNACAPSQGGQVNCDNCCGPNGGFCYDFREADNFQGCLCL